MYKNIFAASNAIEFWKKLSNPVYHKCTWDMWAEGGEMDRCNPKVPVIFIRIQQQIQEKDL
jgi:hypothetical protein